MNGVTLSIAVGVVIMGGILWWTFKKVGHSGGATIRGGDDKRTGKQ